MKTLAFILLFYFPQNRPFYSAPETSLYIQRDYRIRFSLSNDTSAFIFYPDSQRRMIKFIIQHNNTSDTLIWKLNGNR